MKKLLTLSLLLICSIMAFAQNTLNVWQKGGGKVSYAFSNKPKVTYTIDNLILTTTKETIEYPLESLYKFTFEDIVPNGIEFIKSTIISDGFIRVYTINGTLVKSINAEANGTSTFTLEDLPTGLYIIKSNNTTYKIIKK